MNRCKRAFCFLLAGLLLLIELPLQVLTLPQTVVTVSAAQTGPTKVQDLKITTAGKPKTLCLTWKAQSVTGYQIYRSVSGQTGTYKKIATLRNANKTKYVDQNLKASKTYFYAVRAYCFMDGKNVFGPFKKINLSTALTDAYVKKYLKKANRVSGDWLYAKDGGGVDYDHAVTLRLNGEVYTYYLVKNKKIKSLEDIKRIVGQYFELSLLDDPYVPCPSYIERNGRVYAYANGVGCTFIRYSHVKIHAASDRKTVISLHVDVWDMEDNDGYEYLNSKKMTLVYRDAHWIIRGDYQYVDEIV